MSLKLSALLIAAVVAALLVLYFVFLDKGNK
jgi:hypothetical protein